MTLEGGGFPPPPLADAFNILYNTRYENAHHHRDRTKDFAGRQHQPFSAQDADRRLWADSGRFLLRSKRMRTGSLVRAVCGWPGEAGSGLERHDGGVAPVRQHAERLQVCVRETQERFST